MSRVNHLSNGKSVMILGTVVGCLIILWPKIFFPMIQGGFQSNNQDTNLKSKIHPRMMASKSLPKSFNGQENFYGPNSPPPAELNSVGSASVGLIMTVYTIGIIFLFFYTIFKYFNTDDSMLYLDDNSETCPNDDKKKSKDYDYKQGECLKKLAVNYVRCKSKLSEKDIDPRIMNDEDGLSMAYRTLLGDMLELRDYLFELQCSINECDFYDDECCDCSNNEVIYNQENDSGMESNDFNIGEAIDQLFECNDPEEAKEMMGTESTSRSQIDSAIKPKKDNSMKRSHTKSKKKNKKQAKIQSKSNQ